MISLLFFWTAPAATADAVEFRGLWVSAWSGDLSSPERCARLIADTRAANFNSLIVQVRRRGDAFYNSRIEPKYPGLTPPDFDPLAHLLKLAHDTSDGKKRIDVHAWIVTYHVWNRPNPPSQPDHPYHLRPEWLMTDVEGNLRNEGQFTFDPGHPDVQRYTFDVCMDIINNYNVDGLHFDYIRYASPETGYHDVTLSRFNRLFNRSGKPEPRDELWKQFRRDQLTALLRKVYLSAIAARPDVKISASTITWAPGVSSIEEWTQRGRPYNDALQDWRAWMEEGILDINIPMNYFRHHNPEFAADYYAWNEFIADHRYNRHAVIGPGIYLNTVSNAIHQMRAARNTTARGNRADGVSAYVYHLTNNEGVSTRDFLKALVRPGDYDPVSPPIFAKPAAVPPMPWKTAPTTGHLKGFVSGTASTNTLDGAMLTLTGTVERKLTSDATGFFGSVDLPPGAYSITANHPGFSPAKTNVTIAAGKVSRSDLLLRAARPD